MNKENVPDSLPPRQLGKMFYNTKPFDVISIKKETTDIYTGPDDTSQCKDWVLTKKQVEHIIKSSESIDGTYWDLGFAFMTCETNGQLRQNGEIFDYSVNAGSWFSIKCRDTTLLFGYLKKSHRNFF